MYEFVGREYGVTADNTTVIEAALRTVHAHTHGWDGKDLEEVLQMLGLAAYDGHAESHTTRGRYVPTRRETIG